MTESDVLDNPNETAIVVMWFSATEKTDEEFGCFNCCCGIGDGLKKGIFLNCPWRTMT